MLIIGSHVSFSKEQLLGATKEALEYGANTFMFYTGAPQNTKRSTINYYYTIEAYNLMKESGIALENVVCHAPYIINLANNSDIEKYKFAVDFLIKEVERCELLGITKLVLHPGSSVGIDRETAINNIIYALNLALDVSKNVSICLETMAGKGSEIGQDLNEIKTIIKGIEKKELIGVCLDTCHLSDSGVDIHDFDAYLDEFDRVIGLDKIKVMHINDSKNPQGAHKDRHENIGFGEIGFDALIKVIYNSRLENVPKILETPYVGDSDDDKNRLYPPYKYEIAMIKKKVFNPNLKQDIRNNK